MRARENPEKKKARNAAYYAANRAIIDAAKDVPCKLCGQRFPVVCMDFHHRDPADKEICIGHAVGSRSPAKLAEEIAKCDVYCSNCHRIIEHGRR